MEEAVGGPVERTVELSGWQTIDRLVDLPKLVLVAGRFVVFLASLEPFSIAISVWKCCKLC